MEILDEGENLWTLSSFIGSLEKEKESNIHLREAFNFGRMAMRVANGLKEETGLRKTIHALVNSALIVATNIYRIHLSVDQSEEDAIRQEASSELDYCQKLLEYLDSMIENFSLIKKMKEQVFYLRRELI